MPAGGIPPPILQIEAATISQEPVEMVEDLEAEVQRHNSVKRKCAACLDVLRKALPLRGGEEGAGEATNDTLHAGDTIDSALIGRTIEKCAMMLVSIIHDCPMGHKSWPVDSEVRRPCCCDIVSRTRQEIEEELRVRYGDLGIFPYVDEGSTHECHELVEETDDAGTFEERQVSCPTFVGSLVEFSKPPVVDGFDREPALGVSGETALSMTVRCDDVPRTPEPRSPAQMNGVMTDAVTDKAPEYGEGGEGDVMGDRGRFERATVSVKMEEVPVEDIRTRGERRGVDDNDGKNACSDGASTAAAAAATFSIGAGVDVGRGQGSIGSGRKSRRCISSSASKASTSGKGGRRGGSVVASPPEAEPGGSAREILKSGGGEALAKSESGAALAAAPGTGNGRASQSKEKVVVEALVHVRTGRTSEGRPRHRGNRQDLEKRREQASEPRCLREGCPEPAVHGPEGGRPLWCHLDYVVQESGRPIRCSVLESNFKACWKETGWAWPGKPPTHCNMHRHSGMVDVVEFLRERFDEIVWPKLLALGWRTEKAGRLQYWLPHDVVRGTTKFRSRVDYFDRKPQVIRHCLRTDKLYGLLLGDLLEQTSGAFKGAPAKPKDEKADEGSSIRGVSIYTSQNASLNVKISGSSSAKTSAVKSAADSRAPPTVTVQKSKHEQQQQQLSQRQRQDKAPQSKSGPAPKAMFTHQLFSLKPPAAKKPCDTGAADTSKKAGGSPKPERKKASKSESAGDSGSVRVTRKESAQRREYKWQRAAKLRAAGKDARIVTGAGISQSCKRVKVFLKRMEPRLEPREDIGDPLAALVVSLGKGFDAFRPRAEEGSAGDAAGHFDSSKSEAQLHNGGEASVAGRGDVEHLPEGAGADVCSVFPIRRLSTCKSLPGRGDGGNPPSAPLPPASMVTNPCVDDSASLQQQLRPVASDCTREREARSEQGDDNCVQSGEDDEAVALSEEVGGSHRPERLLGEVGNGGGKVKVEMEEDKDQNGREKDAGKYYKGKRKADCLLKR